MPAPKNNFTGPQHLGTTFSGYARVTQAPVSTESRRWLRLGAWESPQQSVVAVIVAAAIFLMPVAAVLMLFKFPAAPGLLLLF